VQSSATTSGVFAAFFVHNLRVKKSPCIKTGNGSAFMIAQTSVFWALSFEQVSSSSASNYSSDYSRVYRSINKSYRIVSTMPLMSSKTYSSDASLAFLSSLTVF